MNCIHCGKKLDGWKQICDKCRKENNERNYEEHRKVKKHNSSKVCEKCGRVMQHRNKNISCVECECGNMVFIDGLNGYKWGVGDDWMRKYSLIEDN